MNIVFTICSNNYLAQAKVLGRSVEAHVKGATFIVVLVDKRTSQIDYAKIPFEVLPIAEIEPAVDELAHRYDIVELNTCVKPRVFEYLFETRDAERILYLDPDTRVYGEMTDLERMLDDSAVVLTPHIVTPIPLDDKVPGENTFLTYGVYNLGFIALKRSEEAAGMIRWWKERTYAVGYHRPHLGTFVDQLCMNLVPIFFENVSILRHVGYNMAPWNLHERHLERVGAGYRVNGTSGLVFFHFSGHRIDSGRLPGNYNRFSVGERPDLVELVREYNDELKDAGYLGYSKVSCAYVEQREKYLGREGPMWRCKTVCKHVVKRIARLLPVSLRRGISRVMAD